MSHSSSARQIATVVRVGGGSCSAKDIRAADLDAADFESLVAA